MSLWRQLARGLRALTNRTAADQDVADEVQHYLEQATSEHIARGLPPQEARRAAQLELGSATLVREQVRGYGWENVMGAFFADLRYGGRMLLRRPGFTAVAILTLGLGIGACTAIFSAVNPILFQPLPYPQANRILMISDYGNGGAPIDVTYGTYTELARRSRSFAALAVADRWQPALTGIGAPERLPGQRVTSAYFRALGVPPALGRDFDESDVQINSPKVALLSHGLWQRRFGGDPAILERPITLNGDSYTVIGILPQGFENELAPLAEVWAPLQYRQVAPFQSAEWGHHVRMVGRLKMGVTPDQARREIDAIAHAPLPEFPRPSWADLKQGLNVHVLQDDITRDVKPALLAVLGAVLLVLAIACVNVTNLLLASGAQRRGEFAMRAALGAARVRMVRQLLTESLLLAALGGALGIFLAELGVGVLVALSPPELPRLGAIAVNGSAFAFALGITTVIGLAVGLIPALHVSRRDLHADLQQSSQRTAGGHQLTRRTLVVAEVALALVLLVSAGLLFRSLQRLFAIAPGFDARHVVTLQVAVAGRAYDPDIARYHFFQQALDAVRGVPGVTSAAFTSQLPLSGDSDGYGVAVASLPSDDPNADSAAFRYAVTPDYFATMRIPLHRGRLFNAHDIPGAPEAVLVSESFARRVFPNQDPIGQRLRAGPEISSPDRPWDVIVGVVGDVKQTSLALDQPDAFYVAMGQWWWVDNVQSLVVRTSGDAGALLPALKAAIWSVDRNQPIVRVTTMESLVSASEAQRRFALILFEGFGLAALVLAATGIYGVLSGSVTERTREIGVRLALGATRGNILALVVRQAMTLTGLGVLIGLGGAAVASGALVTLLFGISRLDPITYFGVIALLAGVSGIACWLPAWRAARVDPAITLRAE